MKGKKAVANVNSGGRSARGDQNRSASRSDFYQSVAEILRAARANAYRAVNFTMVEAYWNVGRMIVEEEQQGKERAEYGAALLKNLSIRLTGEFGAGFSEQSLRNMRQIFSSFSIRSALRSELTWTHYKTLIRVENEAARAYYATEAADQNWTVSALERQINSLYYERLLLSRDRAPVIEEMQAKTASLAPTPKDFIKEPYVLEFLGIPDAHKFREADLEQAIIDKLQAFMLELGKGFAFVARQQRISTETRDFFIDLVFYNYILKCFVLVDLKTGELTHQDIGQMDMYVRLFEDTIKGADDNPSVVKEYLTTAADGKNHKTSFYNLDVINSVGYRVKSHRGTQFRIWATQRLREYIVKGFSLDDERLKRAGGGNYFEELLARVRDIRSSEKVFWRKVLEIYATSIDYDPAEEASQMFFATVQNKIHWAAHGQTSAKVVHGRVDAEKQNLGLTTWLGGYSGTGP